jgi:hypothetical protein
LWEEGAKGLEDKSLLEKDKSLKINLEMLCPGLPEKAVKGFLARNKRDLLTAYLAHSTGSTHVP